MPVPKNPADTNPALTNPFREPWLKENLPDVICFTEGWAGLPYTSEMAPKTSQTPFDPQADLGTDYALILTGVGSALVALIYLILT